MEAPDKIYICDFGSELSQDWHTEHCYEKDIEYIRKDALLKYLRNEFDIVDFHLKAQDDPVWWGQRNAFQQVIDKIESLSRKE